MSPTPSPDLESSKFGILQILHEGSGCVVYILPDALRIDIANL